MPTMSFVSPTGGSAPEIVSGSPIVFSSSSSSSSSSTSPNGTVLKRKRPARLDTPVTSITFGVPATPSAAARDVVEAEGDGYSVYCKRGRREYMEDRYTAGDNLRGEHKLVNVENLLDTLARIMRFRLLSMEQYAKL